MKVPHISINVYITFTLASYFSKEVNNRSNVRGVHSIENKTFREHKF